MITEPDMLTDDDLLTLVEPEGFTVTPRSDGQWTIGGVGHGEASLRIVGQSLCVDYNMLAQADSPVCCRAVAGFLDRANGALPYCRGEFRNGAAYLTAQIDAASAESELVGRLAAIRAAVGRIQREIQALGTSDELAVAYLSCLNENNVEDTAEQGVAPSPCDGGKGGM
jgi:hypothetical protein